MTGQIHSSNPREGVILLEIDNPPANVLGSEIRARLEGEIDRIETDHSVRVVVLTGRSNAFCAGDDLKEEVARGDGALSSLGQFGRLLDKIERLRVPVVAAINGHAIGGGLELALVCDIRIASESASFLAAGVNVGLMASTYRLPKRIGAGSAATMVLTGASVNAPRALNIGLISEMHPSSGLLDAALDLAGRIASRAPLSVEASKRTMRQAFELSESAWRTAAAAELTVLVKSKDHKEGVAALLQRRHPVFTRS